MESQKILNNIKVTVPAGQMKSCHAAWQQRIVVHIRAILQHLLHPSQIPIPSRIDQLLIHLFRRACDGQPGYFQRIQYYNLHRPRRLGWLEGESGSDTVRPKRTESFAIIVEESEISTIAAAALGLVFPLYERTLRFDKRSCAGLYLKARSATTKQQRREAPAASE